MSTGEKKNKVYAPWGFFAVAILLFFIGPFYFLLWRFPPDQSAWTKAQPRHIEATYDETQPGADDPRVKEGIAAYQAGDFKKAYDIWLPLAEAGNAEAQYRMGRYYDRAEGKQKNIKMAKLYLEKAAAKKHSIAINGLGIMYDSGHGVTREQRRTRKTMLKHISGC
jgi:TPR repeat protein